MELAGETSALNPLVRTVYGKITNTGFPAAKRLLGCQLSGDNSDDKAGEWFMWQEFKTFIARGNVLDLAVAVVIGAAFTAIVTSLTDDYSVS